MFFHGRKERFIIRENQILCYLQAQEKKTVQECSRYLLKDKRDTPRGVSGMLCEEFGTSKRQEKCRWWVTALENKHLNLKKNCMSSAHVCSPTIKVKFLLQQVTVHSITKTIHINNGYRRCNFIKSHALRLDLCFYLCLRSWGTSSG